MLVGTVNVPRRVPTLALVMGILAVAATAPQLRADDIAYSTDIVVIDVSNSLGDHGVFTVPFSAATYTAVDRSVSWAITTSFDILDDDTSAVVATVRSASLQARVYPPKIYMNLTIDAGASDCVVTMSSPLIRNPYIPAAASQSKTFASFTIRDQNNNGGVLSGIGSPGAGAFRAVRNGEWPAGNLISQLVATVADRKSVV